MRSFFTVLVLLSPLAAWAGLELDEGVFTEPSLGLRLPLLEGWRPSTQTGYPGLLLLLQRQGGARIVVGGGELRPSQGLASLAAENVAALSALGMTVFRSQRASSQHRAVWEVWAGQVSRGIQVRQLYLVEGKRFVTLTLAGPAREVARWQSDLLQLLAGLRLS